MSFSGEYMVPIEDAQKLERELAEVTKQRDHLADAIANHNGEALHASTAKNADKKLWDTLADMEGLNYD
jgi:hypothetical protein